MEGVGFRSLIVFLLLAILAFVAGSLASENAVGALAPTAVILGLFFLIYLGKNCWILVFIVPPVLSTIDLSILRGFPVAFMVCGVVLIYMLLLSMMGNLKLKWNYVPVIDYLTLVLCIYFLSTWVRHPVTVNAIVSITDFGEDTIVGGKEYIWCIGAIVCYVALSLVPIQLSTLIKIMKWAFWLSFIAACFMCAKGLITGNVNIGEEAANTRFGAFAGVGRNIAEFIFAKYSFVGVILSPWKLALVLLGLLGSMLSGFRGTLIGFSFFAFFVSGVYRQLTLLIIITMSTWGTLVYFSHVDEDLFDKVPHGVKRVLTVVPGLKLGDRKAEQDAQNSSDWRIKMWELALDPSKGYIKDYTWGDGFGFSMIEEQRRGVSISLGLKYSGDVRFFAERGVWHNGAILIVHRIGIVGLLLLVVWLVSISIFEYRLCCLLRSEKWKEYIYIAFLSYVHIPLTLFFFPGDFVLYFSLFYTAALAKSVYLSQISKGDFSIFTQKQVYIPLLRQENS